jgi:hypothetical protein
MSGTGPVRRTWISSVLYYDTRLTYAFDKEILTCNSRSPPSRIAKGVEQSCRLRTDNPIDISNIEITIGADGKEYKDVHHEVEMKVIGTAVEFTIIYNGKRVGRSQFSAKVVDPILAASSTKRTQSRCQHATPGRLRRQSSQYFTIP